MGSAFSKIGRKLTAKTGILQLMDDLGHALAAGNMLMLGGGNPAAVPEIEQVWRRRIDEILSAGRSYDIMLGQYDPPQGNPKFLTAVAELFNELYGWPITEKNVVVVPGSQSGFFSLFNVLGGDQPDGSKRPVLFPIAPEYIGYADQGLSDDMFRSVCGVIEQRSKHLFKYRVDFERMPSEGKFAAIAISRPTNPTGNVVTDNEVKELSTLAKNLGTYLIVDGAYGLPFPGVIYKETTLNWEPHVILTFSLSKIGLPGIRTGIVIASEEIVEALSSVNAILNLANVNVGQQLVLPSIKDGTIQQYREKIFLPFYKERLTNALGWCNEFFDDSLPYSFHECEGAFFLWLWCKDLPIPTKELYERLKERRVIVVPGEYFFFGLDSEWSHSKECVRINYSQPPEIVKEGLKIIAEEVSRAYGEN